MRRFPDHPSPGNTHVCLEFHGEPDRSPPSWSLSWCCSHFEHDHRNDIVRLIEFLDLLGRLCEHAFPATHVERLADERVHLKVYDPVRDVRDEVLRYGQELEEWQPEPGPVDPETASRLGSMLRPPERS